MLAGLVGIVVVFLPGILLQVVAVTLWAFAESTVTGWTVLGLVVVIAIVATILKYLRPGRQLKEAGIPAWLLLLAAVSAVLGLFMVPIVGAPLFFVVTIYLFELSRKGAAVAWPSTKRAVKAVLTSIGIELAGGFVITLLLIAGILVS